VRQPHTGEPIKDAAVLAVVNALLLAILAALIALTLAMWTSKPAIAHPPPSNFHASVDCKEGNNGCQLRYADVTENPSFATEIAHADPAWDVVSGAPVNIAPDNENYLTDTSIVTVSDCSVGWVGSTVDPGEFYIGSISLNACLFNRSEYNMFERKGTTAHEFGHAVGIGHNPFPNLMYTPSRATDRNTPASHDRSDFAARW
jgi:hypothetical protein